MARSKGIAQQLQVRGDKCSLTDWDPRATPACRDKAEAAERLERNLARIDALQYLLYAEGHRSLLLVLQGMDTSGKDGLIRKVMTAFNPQACEVWSFKVPTPEEAAHDFLWRIHRAAPRRGEIAIFNRSHYEDVLVVRVHELVPRAVWSRRYEEINEFERHLHDHGTTVLKFFLHISREEQQERLLARLDEPRKHWKFSEGDLAERQRWKEYQRAYEDALARCSTEDAPWFVIPSDRKWYRDLAVSEIIADALERMDPKPPKVTLDVKRLRAQITKG
jgi:PPK2 family polyphosphate:nucleotide phosphotransferase